MTATDTLRHEHELILQGLSVLNSLVRRLERAQPVVVAQLDTLLSFFRHFADGCHHEKEEQLLFPMLARHGLPHDSGPIAVMMTEHARARALLATIAEVVPQLSEASAASRAVAAADEYVALMTAHISKENQVLFRMADQLLTPRAAHELEERFAALHQRDNLLLRDGEVMLRKLARDLLPKEDAS